MGRLTAAQAAQLAGFDSKLRDALLAVDEDRERRLSSLEAPGGLGGAGVYNVLTEGVKGDGATDNRIPLQALIDKVAAAGGGRIYFPPGRYLVGQKAQGGVENQACLRVYRARSDGPTYRNITFEGAGSESQIVMYATVFKAVALFIVANGAENIRFHRLRFVQRLHSSPLDEQTHLLKFWGNPTLATATGISTGPKFVDVTDCDFGMVEGDQIQIIGEEAHPIIDVNVSRCYFRGRLNESFAVTELGTRSAIAVQRAVARVRITDNYMDESDDQLVDFEPTNLGSDDYCIIADNVLNGRPGTTVLTGSGVGATSPNVGLIITGNEILNGTVHAINMRQVVFANNHVKVPASPSSNAPVGFTRTVDLCVIAGNTIEVAEGNSSFDVLTIKGDTFGTPNHTVIANNTLRWDSLANGIYMESCDSCVVSGNTLLATNTTPTSQGVEGMDQKVAVGWLPVQPSTGRGISCTGNVLHATGLAMQSFFGDGGTYSTGVVVTGNTATGITSGYRQHTAPPAGSFPVVVGNSFNCNQPVSVTTGGFAVIAGNASGVCTIIGPDGSTALPNSFTELNGIAIGSTYIVRGAGAFAKVHHKNAAGANGWTAAY